MAYDSTMVPARLKITIINTSLNRATKDVKNFLGFQRRDSMSQLLIELSLQSADTVIYNSRVYFTNSIPSVITILLHVLLV